MEIIVKHDSHALVEITCDCGTKMKANTTDDILFGFNPQHRENEFYCPNDSCKKSIESIQIIGVENIDEYVTPDNQCWKMMKENEGEANEN